MSTDSLKKTIKLSGKAATLPFKAAVGRLRLLAGRPVRFQGAYPTYQEALHAAKRRGLTGYDNEQVANIAFDLMCQLAPWDYPVLFWISRLQGEIGSVLDAGGHMGTKYRAFRKVHPPVDQLRWTVYDLPAIARAGKELARAEGLDALSFTSHLDNRISYDLFLGSGLLQYLDISLPELIAKLNAPPRHLLLNKVALRKGRTVVTLERIGPALVPYQIRNESAFLSMLSAMGYKIRDRWGIPSLSHVIDTHPEHGLSESAGFYCELR